MNKIASIVFGALMLSAAAAWSVEPAAAPKSEKPALNLQSTAVQKVIRATAEAHAQSPAEKPATLSASDRATIPFRAPLKPHHVECDNISCVAYSADDVALYTIPREQQPNGRVNAGRGTGDWLSCQSRDNLLTTFERYDKCRGITIGLPPPAAGDTQVIAPGLVFRAD